MGKRKPAEYMAPAPSSFNDPVLEFTLAEKPSGTRGQWNVDPYVAKVMEILGSPKAYRVKLPADKMEKWRIAARHAAEQQPDVKLRTRRVAEDTFLIWAEKVKEAV